MRRCRHIPFEVTVNLPDGLYPGGTIETTYEPDCDEDSCAMYLLLPEEYDGCEIEWISPEEINLHWPTRQLPGEPR